MYTIPSCKILATSWKPRTRFAVRRWWLLEIEKLHTRQDYFLLTSKRLPDITDHSDNWDALFSSEKPHGYEFKLTCTIFPPEVSSLHTASSLILQQHRESVLPHSYCCHLHNMIQQCASSSQIKHSFWEIAELDCSLMHITQIAADATVFYKLPSLVHSQFSQLLAAWWWWSNKQVRRHATKMELKKQ